ncbi:MAG: ABC transporter substrate-binding protein, partial [Planctomycetaceae bacterium]|nr:ABC transporter substrate-binding protein [Planctomycetaceae bacterium]
MRRILGLAVLCLVAVSLCHAGERQIKRVGVTVGSLGNPGFVVMGEGVRESATAHYPGCEVVVVSGDYDLSKQSQQIDDFIAAGMDVIVLNAVDVEGMAPAVRRAKEAGIIVVAMDVGAEGGVDATVTSDNITAGRLPAQYIVDKLGGKGNVVILNGPPATAIMDRVIGAKEVFAKYPDINIVSDNQNGLAGRDESYRIMGDLLTAHPEIDAVFGINDPTSLGCELAIKQAGRSDIIITSVDGHPDGIEAVKQPNSFYLATAAQQIKNLGFMSMEVAAGLAKGKKLQNETVLI